MLAGPPPPASATTLAVSAIAIQSSAGADTQYHAGDDIVIRVTFGTETITAHTGATITIDVGGENRTATAADVASGGANAYVDFTYTVTDSDRDTDGISVAAGIAVGTYTHTDPHTNIAFTQTVAASTSHRVNVDVTNYDTDGDGLIEINSLAQLNAIRYDLDGNGQPAAASISNYAAAFPARSQSHGCPDTAADSDTDPGPCLGYELTADLDFDTNGDGSVNASDAYPNWTPIGADATSYSANFNGNGHIIANLTINQSITTGAAAHAGLFASVAGGTIANVGLPDVDITASFSDIGTQQAGTLVGLIRGTVRNSYATGTLSVSAPTGNYVVTSAGGLVGYMGQWGNDAGPASRLDASWAAVNISVTSSSSSGGGTAGGDAVGGLVGRLLGNAPTPTDVTTSYARGTGTSARSGSQVGGLIGVATGSNWRVTTSYWDTTSSSLSSSSGGSGVVARTTAQLQSPTDYGDTASDTFYGWNINVDGNTNTGDADGNDDPWDFGTASQYPVLKYASHDFAAQGRPFDYDADNDGLIEITTLAQLDAIRHDLDGNGDPAGAAGIAAFRKAFPHRVRSVAGRMGCQPTDHDSMPSTPDRATCTGYELMADLDFDTNGDGNVNSSDDYPNWAPIGGITHASWAAVNASDYTATFEGNGRSISNLYINRAIDNNVEYTVVGLFAGVSGTIRNVDLLNPQISITRSGAMGSSSANRHTAVGGLAGYLLPGSRVDGSRIVGGAVTFTQGAGTFSRGYIGCLTGDNYGIGNRIAIIGSSADCAVTANVPLAIEPPAMQTTSDPADSNHARVGGLVGSGWDLDITASYAAGAVSCRDRGSKSCGGLAGDLITGSNIVSSYATGNVINEFDVPSFEGPTITTCTTRWGIHYNAYTGALVGVTTGGGITDSYATGRVTSGLGNANSLTTTAGARFPQNRVGGLAGWSVAANGISAGSITNSYWDSDTTGFGYIGFGRCDQANDGIRTEGASTTAVLQTPTNYGATSNDPYYQWNRDLDNADGDNDATTGVDDPWDFGVAGEYPVLKYGRHTLAAQGRTVLDYDDDNDGLIDITTLAQLDAVRYDLNGDGDIATANAPAYRVAFPNGDSSAAGRMGCELTDHDSNTATPDQATCAGYELRANLDFDTDGDNTADAPYANWTPIPAYNTAFNGNGRTISNLNISGSGAGNAGLFAQLNGSGRIYSVGLLNPSVRNGGSVNGGTGALAGTNSGGSIYAVYARGGAVNSTQNDAGTGGLVGRNINGGTITASYATVAVNGGQYGFYARVGGLVGINYNGPTWSVGTINYSYAAGSVSGRTSAGTAATMGCLSGHGPTGSAQHGNDAGSYYLPVGCPSNGAGTAKSSLELRAEAGYDGIYADWNRNLDGDATTGDSQGRDDPWDFRLGHFPVLKYGGFDVNSQRPLLAEAGATVEAYSGQTVTLDGSGSRLLGGGTLNYMWAQIDDGDEGDPDVTLAGANTASPTFPAPTGLEDDITLKFRLTVTAGGQSVYDEVVVTIIAVRPNQLLSLSLTDAEGDAVGLAPPFLSLRYDYQASVANQIASVTVTPRVLSGSTMTLNGQDVASGAEVEVPLKYRGNEITIVVTPPEPEPSETMDGETADGETTDETVAETTCEEENDGVKPCTYTVTVRRAVPPRLAFVPRSLTIEEGGTGTYTVELDTRILTGAVTIAIASDHPAVTVSPTAVTLKPLDMAPRTITVTAASDDDRDDENVVITHTANGAHYYDVIATVGVRVNDTTAPPPAPDPALSVSVASLRLAEGGSAAYTVALATRPDDNVTVTIASDNADVTTRPAALAFTTANWATAQRVTVSAASDGDTANDTATLTHTASGGGYNKALAVSVAVSVTDDDTAGLAITPTVLNLIENGISAFIVSLTAQPSGNVTVSIASDNPDVTVRPAALSFTPADWATPQAVLVITRADAGGGDELATLRMAARGGGYDGQTGQVLASVDDKLAPLAAAAVTTGPDAPAGVSVYGPPGTTARASVAAAGADTPAVATGVGFGIGPAVGVSVSEAPDDGLEICLPVSDALRAEAGSAYTLTLLRYAGGAWTELDGARDLGDRVCAGGVTGEADYAVGYALRPGTVLDLAAAVGADPGTIELSWTPPAAGTAQVAVVVNAADDTDYCLDTLPGIEASKYTCAGRTAGQTYVALLIVLLPDEGYTLANIVRFELPAAGSQ